ncbi:hypothetical protein DNTS_004249 [Danionella cerebrum]|uniref:SPX domain-containing protein n=1 Tax=Danionella cerebrum TaxID=2873325 RepID=A0A553MNL0_9TELE|nr:hypothetical protein DNTS_004249 [Danionella translucida]
MIVQEALENTAHLNGVELEIAKENYYVIQSDARLPSRRNQDKNMKFTEHLSAHITPEWRKQYIQYEAFKEMLYSAQDQAPSIEGVPAGAWSCFFSPLS